MPGHVDVPEPFSSTVFLVADAKRAGLRRRTLNGPQFRQPFKGVRIPATLPDTLHTRCRAASLALPKEAAFSHETAARLCDLPIPRFDGEIDVMVLPDAVVPNIRGVDGHTGLSLTSVIVVDGLKVIHPERVFFQLALTLSVDDLVILGDAILRKWSSLERMRHIGVDLARRRGIIRAREALRLIRPGVDSPMETRVRLLIVRAGLPCPHIGVTVVDDTGAWLARPDLSYPELKIAIEYDGDHHRTHQRQWRRDRFRDEGMRDAGWIVMALTADDVLRYSERTIERLRRYVHVRSGTQPSPPVLIMDQSA